MIQSQLNNMIPLDPTFSLTHPTSSINPTNPSTAHYILDLLQQNADRLQSMSIPLQPDAIAQLSDPESLIQQRYLDEWVIQFMWRQLGALVLAHRALSMRQEQALLGESTHAEPACHEDLQQTEAEIFRILGLKRQGFPSLGTVLIIDDTPAHLCLLLAILTQQGYAVLTATHSSAILDHIPALAPDLILLDIIMPDMDGYEVCAWLKANPQTQAIPVIFLSAIDSTFNKTKGFQVGGADYITKPFQVEEVLSRIAYQLALYQRQRLLEQQNQQLYQAAQVYQAKADLYRSMFENAVDGMLQSSLDGRFLQVNQSLARLLQYDSPQALIEQVTNISQFYVRPKRRSEFLTYMQQYSVVSNFESQVHCRDGSKIWISETMRAVKDQQNNTLFFEGTVRDVTDRKQQELATEWRRLQQDYQN